MGSGTDGSGDSSNQTKRLRIQGLTLQRLPRESVVAGLGRFHTLGAPTAVAADLRMHVDLERINAVAGPASLAALRQMKASGMGVIGMKIPGAGALRNKVDESLQFALAQDCVDCFTIGAENREELADLVRKIPAASVRG
jgi:hypothetical protein